LAERAHNKIFVVEDDPDARELATEFLRLHGFEVRAANDGVEALEAITGGYRPDAIVLDLMMPRMDGAQFLARYRRMDGADGVPVIIVTAAPQLAKGLPCRAMLAKPYDLSDLLPLLAR
jgi:two-component system response regulator MprA